MWRPIAVGLAVWFAAAGCASLVVKKVSTDGAGSDHVKGFRYYLSRPYVVVKAPVLVCETSTLYLVEDMPELLPLPSMEATEKVMRINAASGAFESVTGEELAAFRRLASGAADVQPVAGFKKQPPAPVIVQQPPAGSVAAAAAAAGTGDSSSGADVNAADQSTVTRTGTAADVLPDIPKISQDPTLSVRKTAQLDGNIQVVFLPDLDEQYAIHNCNLLSKSAYALNFNDGWQLTDVSGQFDSTAVPLEILNFIDTAIDSAKTVALAAVDREARALSQADPAPGPMLAGDRTVYRVITATYLKPGIYRVNKPWEMAGEHPVCGCGLLAKMGLATFETSRVEMNPTPRTLSDVKQGVSIK
jgi:hypothetical protein